MERLKYTKYTLKPSPLKGRPEQVPIQCRRCGNSRTVNRFPQYNESGQYIMKPRRCRSCNKMVANFGPVDEKLPTEYYGDFIKRYRNPY